MPCGEFLLTATNQWISLIVLIATPIHPASYTTLMTIPASDVRTPIVASDVRTPIVAADIRMPIVAVPPIAIIPIGMVVTVSADVSAAVISTAICTPLNSAVDASNATGR